MTSAANRAANHTAIRALIFDFDGLILDTEGAIFQSYQEIYQAHNCTLQFERWALGIGTTDSDYDPYTDLESFLGSSLDRVSLREQQIRREMELIQSLPLLPGVLEILQAARNLGLKVGLASSSSCQWIEGHLSRLGLLEYFDSLKGRDDVSRTKPSPALFQAVLKEFDLTPEEAVVFEDSPNGILAANRAGIFAVMVPNPLTRLLPGDGAGLRLESLADMPLEDLLRKIESIRSGPP
jgi:HAD superfamily hydrolase (TIGR01509 family)